jgi:hypothetical protein
MTNSESLGAESATEHEPKPAVTMSAGAEMLISRMKTNPEDFKYGGRFFRVVDALASPPQAWVSQRDIAALRPAYEEHIQEAEFSAWVYGEIFNQEEMKSNVGSQYAHAADPYTTYGTNAFNNTAVGTTTANTSSTSFKFWR